MPQSQSAGDAVIPQPWLNHYPDGIDWHQSFMPRPLYEFLYETAKKYGQRPAFDFLGRQWTWRDIADLVDRTAAGLQAEGVGRGVKVGLFLPNSPYSLVAYYAILRAGGTVVNFNPLYTPRELRHQIEDSTADMMVTMDLQILYGKVEELRDCRVKKWIICSFTDILPFPKNIMFRLFKGKLLANIPAGGKTIPFAGLLKHGNKPAPVTLNLADDIAVLQYTGGTTGVSKGAMLTHANVSINMLQSIAWFTDVRPGEDRMLGILPFFHVFAMTVVMNMSVCLGLEIVALPRFDLEETLRTVTRKKVTCFPAVPAIYNAINHHPQIAKFDLSHLRVCIAGGAPLPLETKNAFEKLTGCAVMEGYGLSETSPVATMNPISGRNKPGTVGQPVPGTIVEIVHLDSGQTMPPGEAGEICIRGPQVMKGYWNNPVETANVLKNGRLHTGDVGIVDADGYLAIVDRIKDMIITNGYKVYPRHVEEAIYMHPAVEECIVAGLPDAAKGEVAKAWIKPKASKTLTGDEMKAFLKDKISPIEMPRQIEIRDTPLPKTAVGKLSRKDILAQENSGGKSTG